MRVNNSYLLLVPIFNEDYNYFKTLSYVKKTKISKIVREIILNFDYKGIDNNIIEFKRIEDKLNYTVYVSFSLKELELLEKYSNLYNLSVREYVRNIVIMYLEEEQKIEKM